jgi:type II secretory pathway pseudopilin PulG
MKKAFTIMELLVAVGLLAVVLAAVGVVFNYSIDAQRTAASTAEMMRTLRAITDQLNIDFKDPRTTEGYLILHSEQVGPSDTNNLDALYFFSFCQGSYFQSWYDSSVISDTARIFLGHSRKTYYDKKLPGDFARDMHLLTPGLGKSGLDYSDVSFSACQADLINALGEDPNIVLSSNRPDANSTNVGSLLAQKVGSFKIEWTYGWFEVGALDKIVWWGIGHSFADSLAIGIRKPDGNPPTPLEVADISSYETPGPPYTVHWNPGNQQYWPKALKFTFTLHDSRGLFKNGRKFEHIVYIGP